MSDSAETPLDLLEQLLSASQGNQLGDAQDAAADQWRAFIFRVEDTDIAVPAEGEFEIVPSQAVIPVPLSMSWVRGMTNVRGEIYTVVDFSEFIGGATTRAGQGTNLFLLPDKTLKSALLISGRVSLKSFAVDAPLGSKYNLPELLRPYVSSVVRSDEQLWGVLDVDRLCSSPAFSRIGRVAA